MGRTSSRDDSSRLLEREVGHVRKPHAGRLRVALAFPNTYYVGMSNLGFQAVYRLFNDLEDVVCERVFLPGRSELAAALERPGRSPPGVRHAREGLRRLAFSVSFEWDYTNVLSLLARPGCPLRRGAERPPPARRHWRGGDLRQSRAAGAVRRRGGGGRRRGARAVARAPHLRGCGRDGLLDGLARERGFYVPSLVACRYGAGGTIEAFEPAPASGAAVPVRKAALPASAGGDPPSTMIFTPDTEFGSRLLVEVVRGCANLCRFCWAGYNYLPVRAFPAERILAIAGAARAPRHPDRAGLHRPLRPPGDREAALGVPRVGYSISPASLRLDDLTEPIVRMLRDKRRTFDHDRARDRIRPPSARDQQDDDQRRDPRAGRPDLPTGIENLKLYFMIGLPTETDEDLVAIRDLVSR